MKKTASQILLDTANLLEEEGRWTQGNYFRRNKGERGCSMCAHGAIAYCNDNTLPNLDRSFQCDVINRNLNAAINYQASDGLTPVQLAHRAALDIGLTIDFNDQSATTKQQVIVKLREAAQQCTNS